MADLPAYPLEQMVVIKKSRFDKAIKILEQKKEILEKAYELLFDLTQEKDKELEHKTAKLTQLREALDAGESTGKIQQMKSYLKVVQDRLLQKVKKVEAQQKVVDQAQLEVDKATHDLFQKKKDLEKLEIHKKEWEQEARYAMERKEQHEHDDQGSSSHQLFKREEKRKSKREKP